MDSRLVHALNVHSVETILVNGDFKHGFRAPTLREAREIQEVRQKMEENGRRLVVVRGNHDRGLETVLGRVPIVGTLETPSLRFAHGHRKVPRKRGGWLVLGHEHPALNLRDEVGAAVRVPCFLVHPVKRIVILPALSPWAAGVDPRRRGFSSPALTGLEPDDFEAYVPLDEEVLRFGRVGDLPLALKAA